MFQVSDPLRDLFGALADGTARWPLFLHGPAGTGKTCAVLALCDLVCDSMYHTAEEAADSVINGVLFWERVAECQLPILDEIGARQTVGDLHYQAVKRFADLRDRQPAVYVTNVSPDDIGRLYDDRVASRLLCGTAYELTGDDRRMV